MRRVRTFVVGRDVGCDVRLDDTSVSRRHAEVLLVSGGRLYVTDRATTNGTFVLDGTDWRAVRQSYVKPDGRIRFGDVEMSTGRLMALLPRDDSHRSPGDGDARPTPPPDTNELDPAKGLVRDPETGELLEREPEANVRRRR